MRNICSAGHTSTVYKDFGMVADFWADNDCSVLYAEQRGQNGSDGDYMGFGLIERYDCLDWINWVIGRCGSDIPIYLGGVSMGATTVLMATGLELPSNVHGVVADCGFTSPHAIWKHVANNNLHIAFGIRGAIADALCKKKIQMGTGDYSTIDALQICTVPVMLIHGTDDHFVPVEMTYENYKAYTAEKKKVYKHKGQIYVLSPYDMVWCNDAYYVFGFSESHGKVVKFRVDRMHKPTLSNKSYHPKPEDYDISSFCRKVFSMYDGQLCTVELKCNNELMKVIVDRFGEDVQTRTFDCRHFVATVEVSVSPTFYAWVFTYGGRIKILSPEAVKQEYTERLKTALNQAK